MIARRGSSEHKKPHIFRELNSIAYGQEATKAPTADDNGSLLSLKVLSHAFDVLDDLLESVGPCTRALPVATVIERQYPVPRGCEG